MRNLLGTVTAHLEPTLPTGDDKANEYGIAADGGQGGQADGGTCRHGIVPDSPPWFLTMGDCDRPSRRISCGRRNRWLPQERRGTLSKQEIDQKVA